jgi:hypothetical protein
VGQIEEAHAMSEDQFPRSQRDLVALAMQRGCRPVPAPPDGDSQRDRVRKAVTMGVGRTGKRGGTRGGIRR